MLGKEGLPSLCLQLSLSTSVPSFFILAPRSLYPLIFLILPIYFVVLSLSCGTQDLQSLLPYAGFFLVVTCEI